MGLFDAIQYRPATSDMAVEVLEPFLKGDTGRNTRGLLRLIILCTIAAAAVASRLFSVIRKSSPFRFLKEYIGSSDAVNGHLQSASADLNAV